MEYPGFTATWSHQEASRGSGSAYPLEFFGPRGSLAISRKGFLVSADRRVAPANTVPHFSGAHPVGGPALVQEADPPQYWTQPLKDESGDGRDQFQRHVRNFLDCVKSRQAPVSDLESGHRVATVCHLANISLRLGRKIRWDAAKEDVVGDPEAARMLDRPYRAPWDAELRGLRVD